MPRQIAEVSEEEAPYDVVYVSPHLDDVAFSCSAHLRQQRALGKRVLVVSIFTGRRPGETAPSLGSPVNVFSDLESRLREDEECMRLLDVDWYYACFPEVVFRKRVDEATCCVTLRITGAFLSSWFCGGSAEKNLVRRINLCLVGILQRSRCSWMIAPAGMGYHPDHLLVHSACRRVIADIASLETWFYHDWPYSTYAALRFPRSALLRSRRSSERPRKTVKVVPSPEELAFRKRAVLGYESQLEACFGTREAADLLVDKYSTESFDVVVGTGTMEAVEQNGG
eukprot:TRINITY_DN29855_c0_g1_i1.p1 TRINITY_DN29855_c0_g1~~TRINITY_DN29855_c0_g1_i1.p1  ORF type:complete len:283 (-),score=39.07 TRINITY_DN29855_c0_g1_i1:168-1016(-)